jgi:hypothetical protein
MYLNCCHIVAQENNYLKDFAPFISSVIIILIFIYDRKTAYDLRKKELDRTWYYKVLLEPNLEKLDAFFKDIKASITSSFTNLNILDYDTNRVVYIKAQLLEIEKIKNIIREFELDVLQPIYSKYPTINNEINLKIEVINDEIVNEIGASFLNNFNDEAFLQSIYNHKSSLLNLLYKPLQ